MRRTTLLAAAVMAISVMASGELLAHTPSTTGTATRAAAFDQTLRHRPTSHWCEQQLTANAAKRQEVEANFDQSMSELDAAEKEQLKPIITAYTKSLEQLQQIQQSQAPNKSDQLRALEAQIRVQQDQQKKIEDDFAQRKSLLRISEAETLAAVDNEHTALESRCSPQHRSPAN